MADKEVLYITYDGLTDPLGQSQILPYIIGLTKKGYSFTIISCEKPERFDSDKQAIEDLCRENNIEWHPLVYHKKPPIISTIKDVAQIKRKAFALHKSKMFSIIHCRSYIPSLVGLEMKRNKGVPFIFDMRGFWADERVDGKIWDLSNPIYKLVYRFFKSKEAAFVQHSDAIISLTEAGKKIIMDWPTMKYSNKITVIPCSVDINLFDRKSIEQKRVDQIKKEINSNMVIGYFGSLGTWYMFSEMLTQYKVIHSKNNNAKFLIVSNDIWSRHFENLLVKKKINKEQIYIVNAKRSEMPYYIAATDIALFFITPCFSKLASSPTKHGEIMSMGVPLIANSGVGDIEKIVNETNSGSIVSYLTLTGYTEAANTIPELLKKNPDTIRASAKKYYSLGIAIEKYLDVYRSLEKK